MYKNKKIKVRVALLFILAIFLSSPFIFLETSQSDDEAKVLNEREIRSANNIWSYTTGELLFSVAISSDGQYVAAGGKDNKVYLFDKASSTPLWNYTTGGWILSVAISSDGQYIAAGGWDHKVYLFNKTSSTPLWHYDTAVNINSVAISSDGQYIAAGIYNNVYLFDKASSTPLWTYHMGGANVVTSVAISSDGQHIAAGSYDNKTYLFDKTSSIPLWTYTSGNAVWSVAISSDGQYIAAGSYDDKVYLFDKTSSTPLWNYTTEDNILSVAISSDGQYIAAGSYDDKVYLFDKTSSTPIWNYTTGGGLFSVAISSDGHYITAGGGDNKAYLFDKASSTPLWSYTTGSTIRSVAISSDGQDIAAGGHDYKVYLFDNEPYPFTLSTDVDSEFLNWTISSGATNYSVYLYSKYITEINGSLTLLADGITDLSLYLSGYLDRTYYFIVVARNAYGETLSNCIMVEGLPPANFVLSSNAGDPDDDGLFTLSWTTSLRASNYSVYQYSSFITEINGSLTLVADEITDLSLELSEYSNGTYYYIVVAHNQIENTSSNCISVMVQITNSLTIITPNISSSWECGTSQSISWSSTGIISNVKIELYRNDVFVMEIISSTANDGEVYWVVSSELVSSEHYQIKIIDVSDASIFAYSNYFEIENTSPTEPPGIPGFNVLFLIAALGSTMALLLKERYKSKK